MTEIGEWQGKVGESWAAEWQRTDRSFSNLTGRLIDAMAAAPYRNVIDIGCGAGEISLRLAEHDPAAQITGLDVSPALVQVAQSRANSLGRANVRFVVTDAATWRPETGDAPDLLVSRHGVMFFDAPDRSFANFHAFAAPGARLVFSCFRAPRFSPFFTEVGKLLPSADGPADPHAPGPFAFSDRARVESILSGAGWRDISFEAVDFQMIAGSGADPIADALAYFQRIGPAARILREGIRSNVANCSAGLRPWQWKIAAMASFQCRLACGLSAPRLHDNALAACPLRSDALTACA